MVSSGHELVTYLTITNRMLLISRVAKEFTLESWCNFLRLSL